MVLKRPLLLIFLILSAASASHAAEFLGERHMKSLNKDCSVCHAEQPPAGAPAESVCTGCHGDLQKLGSRPLPRGAVNPHMNHVEELYCSDCHHMHKPSSNYCLQCHEEDFLGMKVP